MECIQQTVNGTSTLGSSATNGTVTVSRNGDLLGKVYVSTETAGVTSGDELVSDVTLEIGGQQIDKQTKEWMQVWNELSTPESKSKGLKLMTGNLGVSGSTGPNEVQFPLQFYFCRNPGLALPLIALQYHEVKMKFTWGTSTLAGAAAVCTVWADYIYLDTEERRRFAQVSHEYLIEQVQYQTEGSAASKYKLNFNHPVKELVWTNDADNITTQTAKVTLNGHDRFATRNKEYFQLRQPYDCHTAVPRQNLPSVASTTVGDGEFVDVLTGTNRVGSAIEAMDFANSAVTSGDVIVSQGGVGRTGLDLSTATAAVTAAEAETSETLIYSFLTTDLTVVPQKGDDVEIIVDGTGSRTNADGTSMTIRTTVTQSHSGALANKQTNALKHKVT
jgi:hypothetical protein